MADVSGQVNRLRRAGVHFALDDFGMSYSSLTYLQRFPVEGIKIDKTFVVADDRRRGRSAASSERSSPSANHCRSTSSPRASRPWNSATPCSTSVAVTGRATSCLRR